MYTFYFRKLKVWQNSRKLVASIYKITNKHPSSERFNFIDQIRRSACSISNNLAEGSAKKSGKEQARYTSIAFGSSMELSNLITLSSDLKYIDDLTFDQLNTDIEIIARQLNTLSNAQIKHVTNK